MDKIEDMKREPKNPIKPKSEQKRNKIKSLGAIGAGLLAGAGIIKSLDRHEPDARPGPEDFSSQKVDERRRGHPGPEKAGAKTGVYGESPYLSAEDYDRAEEHGAFKQKAIEKIITSLPEGFSLQYTTEVEGEPIYDEYITVVGPKGKEYGKIYADDEGNLSYYPDENLNNFFSGVTHQLLEPKDLGDPEFINALITQSSVLEGYQEEWEQFQRDWPVEEREIVTDGVYSLDPDYEAEENYLKQQIREAAKVYNSL